MIRIHNTEAREKVAFEPREPGRVAMYVCGPTVYDACHIGHARPAVVFDTVRRYLEYAGYVVTFISNITDIDDKIIRRAGELGLDCRELASRYQDEYERDMAALGVRAPTIRPKATEHIGEMLDLIRRLEEKGFAYATDRGVWFSVRRFSDYGRLSGRRSDDETTEHRVEQDPQKQDPQDFALWKFTKEPGEPSWPAPWGAGRPGWHIECSAMSGRYSDFRLDIHGGGADLCFPHHENELAQTEALTGETFVRTWMHNGFITVGREGEEGESDEAGEKMGKSKGNAFWLRQAFELAPPAALRLWILGTHYRAPLQYRPSLLESAAAGLDRIYNAMEALARAMGEGGLAQAPAEPPESVRDAIGRMEVRFREAMDDDFNTPQALAVIYEAVTAANTAAGEAEASAAGVAVVAAWWRRLAVWLGVLGLPPERPAGSAAGAEPFVDLLVRLRTGAREAKDFALADRIRDELTALGVELNDRGGETTWRLPG